MKQQDFITAIEITTHNHTTEVVINKSTGNGSTTGTSTDPTLHIKHCCASVVNKLIAKGFSLSMHDGLMTVDKY